MARGGGGYSRGDVGVVFVWVLPVGQGVRLAADADPVVPRHALRFKNRHVSSRRGQVRAVSYTHLTLPTIYSV